MLRDLIVHGRSIFARLDAEVNAQAKYEPYPDSRRVPHAEGGVWLKAVREYFSRSSSDYLRARYDAAVAAYQRREDGTALEQARDYTLSLLQIMEDTFALEAEPLKSTPGEWVSLDKTEVWDLFVSHASEDKESFVRPLVEVLSRHNLSVWFDSATLKLGDSVRAKIDQGLALALWPRGPESRVLCKELAHARTQRLGCKGDGIRRKGDSPDLAQH